MAPRYTATEMLAKLVAFDTTSALSNLALIEFVEDYLAAYGISATRLPNEDGKKASLFVTVGPQVEGGVVLSGHSDVVPVAGQSWSSDPFTLTERGGRLYGRGTCDMKGFLAVGLSLIPEMVAKPLAKPLHFAISYDEEIGCTGVRPMIARMKDLLAHPRAILVGEPTSMGIVNAHKGIYSFYTRIRGLEAHSSQTHLGASAVTAAARLITFIEEMAEEKRAKPFTGSGFEPAYTTFNVGVIQGGTAQNIIARDCWFSWEYRLHPGDEGAPIKARFDRQVAEVVLPWFRRNAPEASIVTEVRAVVPPLLPEDDGPAEALLRHLSGGNQTLVVSYGTEGGLFQEVGYSTVICGPGSIDQAHKPDEFVEITQMQNCEQLLRRLIDWARVA